MRSYYIKCLLPVLAAACLAAGCSKPASGEGGSVSTDVVTLGKYDGVEVEAVAAAAEASDEDVDNYIVSVQKQAAEQAEVDRAVQDGDIVDIDFTGKIDGAEFEGGSAQGYSLTIGSGTFIEGFEESVIGHKAGDSYDWEGKFPDDYYNADYAGKDVVFSITVNKVEEEHLPELDDAFVQTVSQESKTMEEYREEVRQQISDYNQMNYEMSLRQQAWAAVLEGAEVKGYPEGSVKAQEESIRGQYEDMAESYGMEFEEFATQQSGGTLEEFEKQLTEQAKSAVKEELVAEAILEAEGIKLTDELKEEQFSFLAEAYGYADADALTADLSEGEAETMAKLLAAQDWVAEHCVQKEAEEDTAE